MSTLAALALTPLLLVAGFARHPGAVASPHWRAPLGGPLDVRRGFERPATAFGPGHRGVDLAAAPGVTVVAAAPGVVRFAGVLAGRGVVSIASGAYTSEVEPVAASVRVGSRVAAGAPIGRLAAGHGSPPPGRWLLHWGVRHGAGYVDPLTLLGRGAARLLPYWPGASTLAIGAGSPGPVAAAPHSGPAHRTGRPTAPAWAAAAALTAGLTAALSGRRAGAGARAAREAPA
jgi:hypothetical protein